MKNIIARTKEFYNDHKTAILLTTGVTVGATTVLAFYESKTLLNMPEDLFNSLQDTGNSGLYILPFGDVLVKPVPKQ